MNTKDRQSFHQLYGERRPRAVYYARDFVDYALMIGVCAVVLCLSYGVRHVMARVGVALCVVTLLMFVKRHGVELAIPQICKRPQDVVYMFGYKLQNLRAPYLIGLAVLVGENLAISATPLLPHHNDTMRTIGLCLFYGHVLLMSAFRTRILVDHLAKKHLVREVLMQTPWQRVVKTDTSITIEILHAYCTGLLTHIILLAPWYLIVTHARFSVIFLPAVCGVNVWVYWQWLKTINSWFYRDHWIGHNSELEFLFLHGPHHDAIPSGLIGGAENGFLEGFLRFTLGSPSPFLNPVIAFLVYTVEVKQNIEAHQYIPGVFPRLPKTLMEIAQHSTHHYGPIEPYSFAIKVDQPGQEGKYKDWFRQLPDELRNSARLDEELTDFVWDNPIYRMTLNLYERYQK
jgi:hypothetical protein